MKPTILIYGAGGAVGSATARTLHDAGYALHLVDRNEERLRALATSLDAGYTAIELTGPEDFKTVQEQAGRPLGGLVYAIGTVNLKSVRRLGAEDLARDFRLNAEFAFLAVQASLDALKRNPSPSSVVLYSSVAVARGFSLHASLSMAKGAVEGLVRALAAELAPQVRVNGIAPSLLDGSDLSAPLLKDDRTRQALADDHPMRRLGSPEDVAGATAFLLSADSSWISGQILGVDGGRAAIVR